MGPIEKIVAWLRAGYPEGIPTRDYVPMLALLSRRMTDDEIDEVGRRLKAAGMLAPDESHVGAEMVRVLHELPAPEEIHRVAMQLRAQGWAMAPTDPTDSPETEDVLRPTVHLFYGPAGSGKTRRARQLADAGAIRFSRSDALRRISPHLTRSDLTYRETATAIEAVLWGISKQVLVSGGDVVLDWNARTRAMRAHIVADAAELGADVVVHVLPHEVKRGAEPPSEDEGIRLVQG